ncbi:MAG: amidohydrolase family protein [Gemmatimonadetes bacterium]|jgi:predicted TIM-barrel fold metal-dependent hydrolase|nr:amidohydrolase family protein [Gemmatimonadota bacterium]MBT5588383.1 amidohydrolase family protein [Gemmatimonadota bacterium]MBT5963543.1 amidohydrolase family protein [Gemmatimonadota bacterium]MBT7454070.1 amidohydrolase family protein [Gemmatimonadota bacterium]MBT7595947.1 amidohydrolase family protein [Gemmatimonadota bacterium]
MNSIDLIDVCAWTGDWNTLSVDGDVDAVRESLHACGVGQIHLSSLRTVWGHNLHLGNIDVYEAADRFDDVSPVPLLDPTLATWADELARATQRDDVSIVRLLPAYSGYTLDDQRVSACAEAVQAAGLILSIQMRIEDERRNHPKARVPDVPFDKITAFAHQYPDLPVVIGGAPWRSVLSGAGAILASDHIYAETSQMDGVDSIALIIAAGLGERLLFATHTPLFMPLAGVARILLDLSAEHATAILGGNASRLLNRQV